MIEPMNSLQEGDGLLLVDVQRDFCPGGALPVEEGHTVVPILNCWIEAAKKEGIPIYASRDWHPINHLSFAEHGGRWPAHCIQDSDGAVFHPDLRLPDDVVKVTKGVRFDQDQNSAFDQTGLADQLEHDGVSRLWVGGLAQDVCVLATVLDALNEGFEVCVLAGATKPVNPVDGKKAMERMTEGGARIVND
jgi:nicotinamidase/pyrazinamidase